jgi:cardiolipin synthase
MNLPNILTIFRFALIPVFLLAFFDGNHLFAFEVVVLAALTDVADGYIARKYNLITEVGKMLDPLADKCMVITVILSLAIKDIIPWPAAALIFSRDILMILSATFFHFNGKQNVPANVFGKITTILFYIVLWMLFFEIPHAVTFLYTVILFSFVTTAVYAIEFKLINGKFLK